MRPRILLVDDDAGLLRLISLRLESAGYDVVCQESGEKALAFLNGIRPDLVVTDLRMDGMDGMALFDAVRETHPSIPVIILTAHGSIPDAVEATKRGVFSFLTKPFDSKVLLEHVDKALHLAGAPGIDDHDADSWRAKIITRSPAMLDLLSQARLVAQSDASVLIHGESGTGKELLAEAIHLVSPRRKKPFLAINCGAIPETLLESELFGHSKGAFTGASESFKGLFQSAEGGTIFLDEIGDMPLPLQVKLLRVLQERAVRPLGGVKSVPIDVRIISATHRNLEEEMEVGTFREDLFYRLKVVALEIPSLEARREDIPLLAGYFLEVLQATRRGALKGFTPEAMRVLMAASWPGNVRQLRNVVEQAVALSTSEVIPQDLVERALQERSNGIPSLIEARQRFEREYLAQVLRMTNGNVTQAAAIAQRNRTDFYKLLRRHGLDPVHFKLPHYK